MAFAYTCSSSTGIYSATGYPRPSGSSEPNGPLFSSVLLVDRPAAGCVSLERSGRRCAVSPVNAEPKRNDSIVRLAATAVAPGVEEKGIEAEDYEVLAKKLDNASPLEVMDKALERFGDDIAIAFRPKISKGNKNIGEGKNVRKKNIFRRNRGEQRNLLSTLLRFIHHIFNVFFSLGIASCK